MISPSARIRIKASVGNFKLAKELAFDLLHGRVRFGAEPGALYCERLAGVTMVAHRLRCGGVEVRELGA